ncbi:hypothetical protein [Ruminococcus flavefaciens]|nr:hypothetical protein [Ruminococcus flavefaciens]MDD7517224.1 hypothetical protein [Ruminococcus flavefaciens]MDY5691788.1 hypothetical protein [Ruminococcus flavefaciens]
MEKQYRYRSGLVLDFCAKMNSIICTEKRQIHCTNSDIIPQIFRRS